MPTRNPSVPTDGMPTPPSPLRPDAGPSDRDRAGGALEALVATGAAPWDAALMLVGSGFLRGDVAVLDGVPDGLARVHASVKAALAAFSEWSQRDVRGANAAFQSYLGGRKVTRDDGMSLRHRGWLERAPDNLEAHSLNFHGCANLVSLGQGLKVPTNLRLTECPRWDGFIPEGTVVRGRVITGLHPDGIRLDEWRRLHPQGECAPSLAWARAYVDGSGDVAGDLDRVVREHTNLRGMLASCERMATVCPDAANAALNRWVQMADKGLAIELSGLPWLTSLPEGIVARRVFLCDCPALKNLPPGMDCGMELIIGRVPIEKLPTGLKAGELVIWEYGAWDGWIPADASIERVVTPMYDRASASDYGAEDGIALEEWRWLHPDGEVPVRAPLT